MIKKCPHCWEAHLIDWIEIRHEESDSEYAYKCLNCKAQGPPAASRVEALDLWNKRRR